MTTAQVVETSVTVNNNSPIQDYVHPDDQTQPFEMTPGFKPFTVSLLICFLLFARLFLSSALTESLAQPNIRRLDVQLPRNVN